MRGRSIFQFWFFDVDLGVFVVQTQVRGYIVPVLEFAEIGKDGDFTKPFTYSVEYFPTHTSLGTSTHRVSRNVVPPRVVSYFRSFYRSGQRKRPGVAQEDVGLGVVQKETVQREFGFQESAR